MRCVVSSDVISFDKENLDVYLKELAKEFRKQNGKTMPAEIILIGGASVLANYGFRDMTYDMDAVIVASSAMKLLSGRKYKNDLSDVVGILMSHEEKGDSITMERIRNAVIALYGTWNVIPVDSAQFIEKMLQNPNYTETYHRIREEEAQNKDILLEFEQDYPGVTNEQNIDDILKAAAKKLTEKQTADDKIDFQFDVPQEDDEDLEI